MLILDQLDAIRWTATHSSTAMDVCKELIRQVRALRRARKKITVVFACRTFDLENDQEIKNLLADTENQGFAKITVKELSDEQLKKIIGRDFAVLTGSQKRILSCPQNLAIWMELKKNGAMPDFRSATELMRRFWENRRQVLEQEAGIAAVEMDEFLKPLLDYMESRGEISAPASIAANLCTYKIKSFFTSGSFGTITWATDSTSPVSTLMILPKITTVLAISMTVPVTI